jgi:hypothetical protein
MLCNSFTLSSMIWVSYLYIFGEEYKVWSSKLCNFPFVPVTFSALDPNILFGTLLSHTLKLCRLLFFTLWYNEDGYQRFEGKYCLQIWTWRLQQHAPLNSIHLQDIWMFWSVKLVMMMMYLLVLSVVFGLPSSWSSSKDVLRGGTIITTSPSCW